MINHLQYLQFSPYFALQEAEKPEERREFLNLFDKLSQKVRELLTSLEVSEKLMSIGKTFGLEELDTEALSFAVRKIATGEVFVGNGTEFIAGETGLPIERARELLNLIVNEVFTPALEDIKKIQAAKFPQTGTPVQSQVRPPIKKPEPSQTVNPNVVNLRNRQN